MTLRLALLVPFHYRGGLHFTEGSRRMSRPVVTTLDLFAFWEYDLFPYCLGGLATRMQSDGRVYVPAYLGWFQPLLLVPAADGAVINSRLEQLREVHRQKQSDLHREMCAVIAADPVFPPRLARYLTASAKPPTPLSVSWQAKLFEKEENA